MATLGDLLQFEEPSNASEGNRGQSQLAAELPPETIHLMNDGHGLWDAMSEDVRQKLLAYLTGGQSVPEPAARRASDPLALMGLQSTADPRSSPLDTGHGSSHVENAPSRERSPSTMLVERPQDNVLSHHLHGSALLQAPSGAGQMQPSSAAPQGTHAPGQFSPGTIEAATLLAQVSRGTVQTPHSTPPLGGGRPTPAQRRNIPNSGDSQVSDTRNRSSQQRLAAISRSITDCMDQIDRVRRQPSNSRHEELALMLRVETLEAKLRAHLLSRAPQPLIEHHSASQVGRESINPSRAQHHTQGARKEMSAPPMGDAPAQLAASFENLLKSSYMAPANSQVGDTYSPDNGCQSKRADTHHVSVSEASHSKKHRAQATETHDGSRAEIQSMVSEIVRECLRDLQSTKVLPTVQVTQPLHSSGRKANHCRSLSPCSKCAEDAIPSEQKPVTQPPPRSRRLDNGSPQSIAAPHGSPWWNRELHMPKFKGEPEESPLEFLTKFKRFATALPNISLDQACRQCMPVALTDEAEQWLNTQLNRWPEDYSFQEFSVALTDRFLPHDYVDRMRRFLETRMQGESETLARFITVIETAYDRSGIVAPEREVVRRICSQLNPTYNQLIGHRYFGSLDELSQQARSIDAQVHRQRSFKVIEADCPDADLKVKAPVVPNQTQRGGRRGQQRQNASPGGDSAPATTPPDSKASPAGESNATESNSVRDERRCYTCGDPSHMRNKCPLSRDQNQNRGSKNVVAPPSNL